MAKSKSTDKKESETSSFDPTMLIIILILVIIIGFVIYFMNQKPEEIEAS